MRLATLLCPLALLVACGGAGMGQNVRTDVTARMQTVQSPIAACYEAALQRDRKLRGRMVVELQAAAKTGKFSNVRVVRTELPDPALEQCVVGEVAKLSLAEPQSTNVSVTYPLDFEPSN